VGHLGSRLSRDASASAAASPSGSGAGTARTPARRRAKGKNRGFILSRGAKDVNCYACQTLIN
jgi:hypothetical protein